MNNKKAVIIVGRPGTGKTTMVERLRSNLSSKYETWHTDEPYLPQQHWKLETDIWTLLGKYDGEGYAQGTDRLSMGVQPHFAKWVEEKDLNLIFEGDRLANMRTIRTLLANKYKVLVVFLVAEEKTLKQRYKKRSSNQSEVFLKGRKTKIENLGKELLGLKKEREEKRLNIRYVWNDTQEQRLKTEGNILTWMIGGDEPIKEANKAWIAWCERRCFDGLVKHLQRIQKELETNRV